MGQKDAYVGDEAQPVRLCSCISPRVKVYSNNSVYVGEKKPNTTKDASVTNNIEDTACDRRHQSRISSRYLRINTKSRLNSSHSLPSLFRSLLSTNVTSVLHVPYHNLFTDSNIVGGGP